MYNEKYHLQIQINPIHIEVATLSVSVSFNQIILNMLNWLVSLVYNMDEAPFVQT